MTKRKGMFYVPSMESPNAGVHIPGAAQELRVMADKLKRLTDEAEQLNKEAEAKLAKETRVGHLLTALQVENLPDGEYRVEEFTYKRIVARRVVTESRYKVWRIEDGEESEET